MSHEVEALKFYIEENENRFNIGEKDAVYGY